MRKSHNRAVLAARAEQNRATRSTDQSVSRNLAARAETPVQHCEGSIRRTRAVPMTGAQRNSQGKRSEWNASMHYWTDPAWSQTLSNQKVGG